MSQMHSIMTTNEQGYTRALRKTHLDWPRVSGEIWGNLRGDIQAFRFDEQKKCLISFNNGIWTDKDKKALLERNTSGSSKDIYSPHVNGIGIRLVTDRICEGTVPMFNNQTSFYDKYWCTYYVVELDNNNNLKGEKCYIGGKDNNNNMLKVNWQEMNDIDIERYRIFKLDLGVPEEQKTGTISFYTIK